MTRHQLAWLLGAALIVLLAIEGHHLAHFLPQAERALEELGPWGPLLYVAAILVLEPFLFPNFIFGVIAGVVFGLWKGFLYYFGAVYAANLLVYVIGRRLLRKPVLRQLERRPKLREAAVAASTEGTGLVFWLRLIPANPAILSYALGALRVLPRSVAIGTLGMAPHMFVDVYLGSAASHVTQMAGQGHASWESKGVGLLLGLVAVAVVSWRIARIAQTQIRAAGIAQRPVDAGTP
ncbi:MAG: VTT domain-containing protein [Polyangiales bacterium]